MPIERVDDLKRLADEAEERFGDRVPYLIWNEANAVGVVGLRPPADIEVYHDSIDHWAGDVELLIRLSDELRDAQLRFTEARYTGRTQRSMAKKIIANWETRNLDFKERLVRIKTLRAMRPRT